MNASHMHPLAAISDSEGWLLHPLGAAIMIVSVSTVVAMTLYCLKRVLALPPVEMEDIKGPLEIDTGDTKDPD
jgi:hypothetical protein